MEMIDLSRYTGKYDIETVIDGLKKEPLRTGIPLK